MEREIVQWVHHFHDCIYTALSFQGGTPTHSFITVFTFFPLLIAFNLFCYIQIAFTFHCFAITLTLCCFLIVFPSFWPSVIARHSVDRGVADRSGHRGSFIGTLAFDAVNSTDMTSCHYPVRQVSLTVYFCVNAWRGLH